MYEKFKKKIDKYFDIRKEVSMAIGDAFEAVSPLVVTVIRENVYDDNNYFIDIRVSSIGSFDINECSWSTDDLEGMLGAYKISIDLGLDKNSTVRVLGEYLDKKDLCMEYNDDSDLYDLLKTMTDSNISAKAIIDVISIAGYGLEEYMIPENAMIEHA